MPLKKKVGPPYYNVGGTGTGYRTLQGVISQTSTNAPTIDELQNTLEESYVLSRFTLGIYMMTFGIGTLPEGKTWLIGLSELSTGNKVGYQIMNDYQIQFTTRNSAGTLIDDGMNNIAFELRIYN